MIKLILTVAGKMMKSTIQDQISYATVCYKNIEITVQKKLDKKWNSIKKKKKKFIDKNDSLSI
jgi:hypothetical protein